VQLALVLAKEANSLTTVLQHHLLISETQIQGTEATRVMALVVVAWWANVQLQMPVNVLNFTSCCQIVMEAALYVPTNQSVGRGCLTKHI
jgi:hypothetical protein